MRIRIKLLLAVYVIILIDNQTSANFAQSTCSVVEQTIVGSIVCNITGTKSSDKIEVIDRDSSFGILHRDSRYLILKRHVDREDLIKKNLCDRIEWRNDKRCFLIVQLANSNDENSLQFFQVRVEVLDINDHKPTFDKSTFAINIDENTNEGKTFVLPKAIDPDHGVNGTISYELEGKDASSFNLVTPSGKKGNLKLKTLLKFDREVREKLSLTLLAKDGGNPPRSSTLQITVNIRDVNDNKPEFDNSIERIISVKESTHIGYEIAKITATDRDTNSNVVISIPHSADSLIHNTFDITSAGHLTLKRQIDYDKEPIKEYVIPLIASDSGTPSFTASASLTVKIEDVNDNSPQIRFSRLSSQSRRYSIMENKLPEAFILMIEVSDADSDNNGQVQCQLRNSPSFSLESLSLGVSSKTRRYKLLSATKFDREMQSNYTVIIECRDHGRPVKQTQRSVRIWIDDENDNGPEFEKRYVRVAIKENQPPGTQVIQLKAKDPDEGVNAQVKYSIDPKYDHLFRVDVNSGWVRTVTSFDREKQEMVQFVAKATDAKNNQTSSSVTVQVIILDENDCKPVFIKQRVLKIEEGRSNQIGKVQATDADSGVNGQVFYRLQRSRNYDNYHWSVNPDGNIFLSSNTVLDREKKATHELVILAIDRGRPPNTATTTVLIEVLDKNDNSPVFINPNGTDELVNITRKLLVGSLIYKVRAEDKDEGENARIQYNLQLPSHFQGYFAIDEANGEIRLNHSLPRDGRFPRKLVINAQDFGTPPKSTFGFLTINLVNSKGGGSYGGYDIGHGGTSEGLSRKLTIGLGVSLIILIFACILLLIGYCCYSLNDMPRDSQRHETTASRNSAKKHSESSKFYGLGGFRLNKSRNEHLKKDQSATKIEFEPILCTVPVFKGNEIDANSENGRLDSKLTVSNNYSEEDNLQPYVQWNQNSNTTYWTYSVGKNQNGLPVTSTINDISPYTRLTQSKEPVYQYQTYQSPTGIMDPSVLSQTMTKNESNNSEEVMQILRSNASPRLVNRPQFTAAANQLGSNSSIYNKDNQSKTATILRHGGYVSGSPCYTSSFV